MNWSFPILVGALALFQGFSVRDAGPAAVLFSVLGFVVLYSLLALSIVAHEFGHALTGRRFFGTHCEHITMHALGGVAMMEIPKDPKGEFWVALAGPVVSLVLAILLVPLVWLTQSPILYLVMVINFWVFLFNLAPALPMDGGRMLRAALSWKMGHFRATKCALKVSRVVIGLALLLGILYKLWFLLVVAGFVLLLGFGEEHALDEDYR